MSTNLERGKYLSPEGSAIPEYLAAMSCSSLIFGIGCVLGWTSPGLAILMGSNTPMPFTDWDASMILAASSLGFGISPVFTPFVADRFGRKNSLLIISIPMMVNWGLIAIAKNAMDLIIARFIAGIAAGLGVSLAPMYLGEIASVKLRGALGMVIGTMVNAGILAVFVFTLYTSLSTAAWIYFAIAAGSMISLWFIPESPYFLAMVGRMDEAEGALERLRGKTDVGEEMNLIKKTVNREDSRKEDRGRNTSKKCNAFKQLITVSGNRKAFIIIVLFVFVLQCGSYVTTILYTPMIFTSMKTNIPVNICTCIVAGLQLVFNILTAFVVDRLGRKPLIFTSGIVSGLSVLVVGTYFYLMEYTEVDVVPYSMIPLGAIFVNIIAISFGFMPLQLVLQSEIFATEIKALASALVGVAGGILALISTVLYLKFVSTWNMGQTIPFFVFCVVTWTTTAIILLILPETKGKNFLEIQRALNA